MADTTNNGKDKNTEGHGKGNDNNPKEKLAMTRVPRGRPLGSKNKPKQPIVVAAENIDNVFKTHFLEFASGVNIAESLLNFSITHQMGLCVLSANGAVTNITLRKTPGAIMLLNGRFDIISMNGSFLPLGPTPTSWLNVLLASGDKGGMIGGSVVGSLIASGPVIVMVGSFGSAIYERLPLPSEENGEEEFSGGDPMLGLCGNCGQNPCGPLNL
ncbi:hypothetical protein TanjilG_22609 [Lupinus angustifolius]|uniref:AT-hook motif nuclear-localized protein n=1 Tax=Lupinus angustifolius TaxID=3871 RepID=A0A4P1RT51_LUPAN|nr:PREDICTED: AT-hook motif nuclear-localized protein 22-like [Lupinus angustifolius]OIW17497.1 hypothetical protein TanjilG_22609 [Lupinus angustifolius]